MQISDSQQSSLSNATISFVNCGDGYAGLESAFAICKKISKHVDSSIADQLPQLIEKIENRLPRPSSAVAYALERRISRENVSLAIHIESLASWAREATNSLTQISEFIVPAFDQCDDLSIKFLARLVPFTRQRWHFDSKAEIAPDRQKLLSRFFSACSLPIKQSRFEGKLAICPASAFAPGLNELARELVLTNYGCCLSWGRRLLGYSNVGTFERGELLKILGLASLNRGLFEDSLSYLALAEKITPDPLRKAHMSCLQSLVAQKRMYDPIATLDHIERGLSYVDQVQGSYGPTEHRDLEIAWLLNSKALSAAIRYRKTSQRDAWTSAMKLLQSAFKLAKDKLTPQFMYLRFNLAANTVFLFEMRGEFDMALRVLEQSFHQALGDLDQDTQGQPESFTYRRAVLLAKAGQLDSAIKLLSGITPRYLNQGAWFLSERVLRATTYIANKQANFDLAIDSAKQGIEICKKEKSALGLQSHIMNLIYCLKQIKATSELKLIREYVKDALLTEMAEIKEIQAPPPKLPAYIPELDLEEVPVIDLNVFLASSQGDKNGSSN